ncbi:DNA polymerase [Halobacillus dabanensis]|uniref:DNA polymerase n=1 Tax=Halobacillus dabanensis TaxID=240302 RepID=A0A1I3Z201_HALDA|nr:uracil-DNA glycosylase [Halobacillus dabanensis]SFK38084.1 DNA polymerase [Halobacillus dabanensis]
MEWPEELVREAKKRIVPYDVEGFVLGKGDDRAQVMIVGEAPGENEALKEEPFIGRAGDELDKQLAYVGLSRESVYITSVVRSRPYKWVKTNKKGTGGTRKANRKPNQKEIFAHAALLDYQIKKMDPDVIIALGGVAYERLTGDTGRISEVIGKPIDTPIRKQEGEGYVLTEKEFTVIPLYHPAAVFYNPKIKEDIYKSLDQLREYFKQGNVNS